MHQLYNFSILKQRFIEFVLSYTLPICCKIVIFSCDQLPYRLLSGLVGQSTKIFPLFLCGYEGVCLCSCQLAKRGVAKGVACFKKAHNFQMDSQTCTKFGWKVGAEDSCLPVQTNWQKGGVAVGVACNKKANNCLMDSRNMTKLGRKTHTLSLVMVVPCP